jgi:hypothetical protein
MLQATLKHIKEAPRGQKRQQQLLIRAQEAGPKVLDLLAMPEAELRRVSNIEFPPPYPFGPGVIRGGSYLPESKVMYLGGGSGREALSHEFTHARQYDPEGEFERSLARAILEHYDKVSPYLARVNLHTLTPLEVHAELMEALRISHPEWRRRYLSGMKEAIRSVGRETSSPRLETHPRVEALREAFKDHFEGLNW